MKPLNPIRRIVLIMIFLTKAQRVALKKVHDRHVPDIPYLVFRRSVFPLLGDATCAMVWVPGMCLGTEANGETHS